MIANKIRTYIPWILVGFVALIIGLQIRLYPYFHNTSSEAYQQGKILVVSHIQNMLAQQVNTRFPDMPDAQKQALVMGKLNEMLHDHKDEINKAFDNAGIQLEKKSGNGRHYLQEIDSYYFLDLTENILETGDVSDQVKGSRYFNHRMLAPLGYWEPQTWHPYLGAFVYKVIKFFDPRVDVMTAVGWTPLVIFPLVVGTFLFTLRALGCSWQSAFISSIFFVLAPVFIERSSFGWYKNSIYLILFPLLSLVCIFNALNNITNLKKSLIHGFCCAVSIAIFAMFWPGWGFVLVLLLASLGGISLLSLITRQSRFRNLLILTAVLLFASIFMIGFLFTWNLFVKSIMDSWGELVKFVVPHFKDWPDLFLIVSELKTSTPMTVIAFIGHPLVSLIAAGAVIYYGWRSLQRKQLPDDKLIVLCVFIVAACGLTFQAERFSILCLTPAMLLFALGVEIIWQQRNKLSHAWQRFYFPLLSVSVILPIVLAQLNVSSYIVTIYNSAWDRAMIKLRDQTPKDSIVNTWWAPGHFIKAIARRRVTSDGASIKGEQSYWMGRVYLAKSEREALGVLRMLNTASNQAAEYLQAQGLPLSKAVGLLIRIEQLNRAKAYEQLQRLMPSNNAQALLNLTHGDLPPSYLFIFNELMDGDLLAYIGKWNFEKVEDLNKDPQALRQIPKKGSNAYKDFVWSLVGGSFRKSELLNVQSKEGSRILFNNGVMVDVADMSASVNSPTFGQGIPVSLVYFDAQSGAVTEKVFDNATLGYSVVFFYDAGLPQAVLMDRDLANSLIVKLYYFDGKGLKYFTPFSKEQDVTGQTRIFIYKVNWPKDF